MVRPTDTETEKIVFCSQFPRGGGMPHDAGDIWGSKKCSKEAEGAGGRKKAWAKPSLSFP